MTCHPLVDAHPQVGGGQAWRVPARTADGGSGARRTAMAAVADRDGGVRLSSRSRSHVWAAQTGHDPSRAGPLPPHV